MGLAVYIHIPYCLKRCPYCDFNTYAVRDVPEQPYVAAVIREAAYASQRAPWAGRSVSTVFLGGGTPSLLSPRSVGLLLECLDQHFGIEAGAEISLEANPATIEGGSAERLSGFRAAGVNRLSIGVQSFNDRILATLGRLHDARQARAAVEVARRVGFDNVSCDLIFAVPGQRRSDWRRDLECLLELQPEHVSAYGLTYEPNTPLGRALADKRVNPVDEATEAAMYEEAISLLASAGYRHYEISNFARPGFQCRHNMTYWTWDDYLGLGAGAHGFHRAAHAKGSGRAPTKKGSCVAVRYANLPKPEAYTKAAPGRTVEYVEALDQATAISEFLLLGLRLIEGISLQRFQELFGVPLDCDSPSYRFLLRSGFLEQRDGHLRLSRRGLLLADSVIARLAAG
ncbi:MAG: radical SAM family heme chaperone HemW [Candidatus Dadabacteria bacterium]|nr:MAG: radical SAM family heme chaperone HemW [Candidatus Dadabacteria bacterium]